MPLPRPWLALVLAVAALGPLAACAAKSWVDRPQAPDAAAVAGYALFAEKDLDRDGALSPTELETGLGPDAGSEARRIFAALDRDGDGRLVVAEYFPDPGSITAFGFTSHHADR